MPNSCSRCARRTQAQTSAVQAADRLRSLSDDTSATEEPMRRYPHPIPTCPCSVPATEDSSAALAEILARLSCQNQLLVDLVEAVNALTASRSNPCSQT